MMKTRLAVIFFILSVTVNSLARIPQLSHFSDISIITCDPGDEALYAAFGHSAIRVYDPENNIDLAFNYGVFDFNQPNFYLNFAKGYLNYKLGVREFSDFLYAYQYYDRTVREQVLQLTYDQKTAVFQFLMENARPENCYYYYDYFYDNCATRVWDVFEKVLGASITLDETYVVTGQSFRDLVNIYTREQLWGDFGIDVCLGLPMDKELAPKEFMFLPDYIFKGFEYTTIQMGATAIPIVRSTGVVYQKRGHEQETSFLTPNVTFWSLAILILLLTFASMKWKMDLRVFDQIWFITMGLLGLFLTLLWTATDHNAASGNLNIFWAIPFHFPAALMLAFRKGGRIMLSYFRWTSIWCILLMICWHWIPQGYNPAFFPIVLVSCARGWAITDRLSKA